MAARFGLERGLGNNLASALGSNEVTLLQLTTAYAMLVNGGKRIEPALIELIQDRHGKTVLRRDSRPCPECQNVAWAGQPAPLLPDQREQVVDPALSYQMVNMLRGVVERGTATRALAIGKPVAGKTGTDDIRDAWFVGFTPDWWSASTSASTSPRPWARRAARAPPCRSSCSSWRRRSKDQPATPFRVPPGVRLRVDADTAAGPPGHAERDPRGVPARHRADRGQHGRGIAPAGNGTGVAAPAPGQQRPQTGGLY